MDRASARVLWLVGIPLCALTLFGMWQVTHRLLPASAPPDPGQVLEHVLPFCKPEPREQGRYVLALVLTSLVLWAVAAYARRRAPRGGLSLLEGRPAGAAARGVEWLLCGVAVAAVAYQEYKVHSYLRGSMLGATLLLAALAGLAWRFFQLRPAAAPAPTAGGGARRVLLGAAPGALALACVAWALLPGVVWERRPIALHPVSLWHVPIQMGEFAAVLGGRTPQVDYFPQYQNLLGYALAPVFQAVGLDLTTFTVAMAALSAVALLAVFAAFRRFTGDGWKALALFLPFVWVTFSAIYSDRSGGLFERRLGDFSYDGLFEHRMTAFSYFAVGPLRYLGPCLTLACLAWYLARPGRVRLAVLFGTAGAALVNNLDFGLPAFGAALIGVVFSTGRGPLPRWRVAAGAAAAAVLGVAAAGVGFALLALARTGRLPDWWMATSFQRAAAVRGFAMLPMPSFGLHWAFFLTFMAAIARGLFDRTAPRLRRGLLLYGGVFGAGAMMYYVGRSHPDVLALTFLSWAFPFLLLTWMSWEDAVARFRAGGWARALTPSVVLLTLGYVALAGRFGEAANLDEQVARLAVKKARAPAGYTEDAHWPEQLDLARFVRAHAAPHEKVVVIAPYGHLIAVEAGVTNVYPFTNEMSLLFRDQVALLGDAVERNGVRRVFGELPGRELAEELACRGFRRQLVDGRWMWSRDDEAARAGESAIVER
jgi:hypothetical protein